jgi:hypothetical protein
MSFYRVYEIDNLYVGELNIQQSITSTYPSAGTVLYTNGSGGTFWSSATAAIGSNYFTLSTGTINLSSIAFIDSATTCTLLMMVSSRVLYFDGSTIQGGGDVYNFYSTIQNVSSIGTTNIYGPSANVNTDGTTNFYEAPSTVITTGTTNIFGSPSNVNTVGTTNIYTPVPGFLSTFTLSTGNLFASSINLIDDTTGSTNALTTSSGILYLNGEYTGGVTQIIAGEHITVSPASGRGVVTISENWITNYLISPPSSIFFGTPESKSSQIFIPWTYPEQINVGFQSNWVREIVSLNAVVSTNVTGINPTILINNISSGGYINYHNGSSYITGVVLTKTAGTSGVQSIVFPQDNLVRNAYVFYNTSLSGLTTSGLFTAWYMNYNTGSNLASTIFSPFTLGGPPSAPQRLYSTNVTSNSLIFYFSTPTFVDTTDTESVATISQYNLTWTSLPIPGRRYGAPVNDSQSATIASPFTFVTAQDGLGGQVIRYLAGPSATTLYPDSTYQFNVSATNSFNIRGPIASTIGISTLNLLQDSFFTSITFPSRYYARAGYTYNRVRSGVTGVTTLVNSATDWTSSAFINPIQTTAARGGQGIGTAYMSTLFTFPSTILGPGQSYNGYPATTPASVTQNALTITPTNVYDKFSASNAQYQGFFLNHSNTLTIGSANFVPNSTIYTLQTTAYQSTSAGIAASSALTNSYYYDGVPGTATITDLQFNFSSTNPPSANWVSGVEVVYATPYFSTITGACNLGNYFYASPIENYSVTISNTVAVATETTFANATTNLTAGRLPQGSRIELSNGTIVSSNLSTRFAKQIQMSAFVNNTDGSSATSNVYISSIVDGPSITLVYTTLPQTLPTAITASAVAGCRIWSYNNFDATNIYVVPFCYTPVTTPLSYTDYLYNHATSLVDSGQTFSATKELQVANGAHLSKATTTDGYINYIGYKYSATLTNTVDYSGITTSGIRFASFAWNTASSGTNYSKITFVINYTTSKSATPIILNNQVVFSGYSNAATDKIFFFYRVEDQASKLPTDANSATTVWLDANGTTASPASAFNYYDDTTSDQTQIYGGISSGATLATGTITFPNVFVPAFSTSGKTIRIFCRIGIPMNWNFAFTTITLQLSF